MATSMWRWVLVVLAVTSSGCERPCEATCAGCCDDEGQCQRGVQPWACGVEGQHCSSCAPGKECSVTMCAGTPATSVLPVSDDFPVSAGQAFRYSQDTAFGLLLMLSTDPWPTCRDPNRRPAEGEGVLLVTITGTTTIELVTANDRRQLTGTVTLTDQQPKTVTATISVPELSLNEPVTLPLCGAFE